MPHGRHTGHVLRPGTEVLTRGFDPSLSVGSARPAVFRCSTYVFSSPEAAERAFAIALGKQQPIEGEHVELIYARLNHPNAEILEDQMTPLEPGATAAAVFNSGLAAIMTAFLTFARTGDSVVYTVPLYGGTQALMHELLEPFGVHCTAVPAGDGAELDRAIQAAANLRIVFIETPANPTMRMTDIRRASASAALARDLELIRQMRLRRAHFGNILPPDECWMLDGRLPTVALRMNRQSKNAQRIAERLVEHPKVRKIHYPTLFDDPEQIQIRLEQCDYPGALFSMELEGGKPAAFQFLRNLHIGRNAVSLGGVETLVCHPMTTTHAGLSDEEMATAGITEGLVRVSVGIEDWRDLLQDFEQALDTV